MTEARISYSQHPGVTPEAEINTLASVYRFILGCREKKAAGDNGGDGAKGPEHARPATPILPYRE